jgi:signal transduction histidine kinase
MNYLELLSALAAAQSEEELDLRMLETVRVLADGLPADEVRLYFIQLSTGRYQLRASWGDSSERTDEEFRQVVEFAASRRSRSSVVKGSYYTAIPILRGSNVPVIVVIRGAPEFAYWHGVETALGPLANVQLDRRSARVLEHLNSRVDYRLPEDAFYTVLGEGVLEASGMQFAALRLIRGRRLDCVAAWGFHELPDITQMSFAIDEIPDFETAAAGEVVAVADLRASTSQRLKDVAGLGGVQAFVALPIASSTEVFAVLTLATTTTYSFANSELTAFEALASSVATMLSTYRAVGYEPSLPELSELSMRSTIEAIAASARHSGLQLVDNAVAGLGFARTEKHEVRRAQLLGEVEADLSQMHYLFERMKFALKPPRYDWRPADLAKLWESAVAQFNARLRLLHIDVQSPTRQHMVSVYPDWIRLVFMQFIINSVDAFAGKGFGLSRPPAAKRTIRLEITPLVDEKFIQMRYVDNAGGINPKGVVSPRQNDESLPLAERIFRPEASSKGEEGSGWGLPLVRTAIRQHGGSVFLVDNTRRGVTFDILLPIQNDEHK